IRMQNAVSAKLVELPHNAQKNGEAQREESDKGRAQVHRNPIGAIEKIDHRESESPEHRSAEGMQNRVPMRYIIVEGTHLTEKDGAIQEHSEQHHHF